MKSATERMTILRVLGLDCWAVAGLGCGSLIAPALAQVADIAPDARSDHSGAHLRFADRGHTEEVRERLRELGYESETVSEPEPPTMEWYTPDELSREEAQVLAARIVPAFARDHRVDGAAVTVLRERLEAALFSRFAGAGPASQIGRSDAIAVATADILGSPRAQALGRFVDRWLDRGTSA